MHLHRPLACAQPRWLQVRSASPTSAMAHATLHASVHGTSEPGKAPVTRSWPHGRSAFRISLLSRLLSPFLSWSPRALILELALDVKLQSAFSPRRAVQDGRMAAVVRCDPEAASSAAEAACRPPRTCLCAPKAHKAHEPAAVEQWAPTRQQ